MVHEQLVKFYQGFRRDAHPMAVMVGVVGALAAFYHDAHDFSDAEHRSMSFNRLIAKTAHHCGDDLQIQYWPALYAPA